MDEDEKIFHDMLEHVKANASNFKDAHSVFLTYAQNTNFPREDFASALDSLNYHYIAIGGGDSST